MSSKEKQQENYNIIIGPSLPHLSHLSVPTVICLS